MCTYPRNSLYIYSICIYSIQRIYIYIYPNDIPISLSSFSSHVLVSRYPYSLKGQGNLEKMTVHGLSKEQVVLEIFCCIKKQEIVQKLRGSLLKDIRTYIILLTNVILINLIKNK